MFHIIKRSCSVSNTRLLVNFGLRRNNLSTSTDPDLKDELRLEYHNDGGK